MQLQTLFSSVLLSVIFFINVFAQNLDSEDFRKCLVENNIASPTEYFIEIKSNHNLYTKLNHQWNLRKPHVYPRAYFLPKSTSDVQQIVFCASKSGIRLIPKSGGHSYESFGEGNSESVTIDFRHMNKITIEKNNKTAVIQPGAMIGSVYYKLWTEIRHGVPMGQCHTVGIGGHALGGGVGYFSHAYGLALDNVLELEMVDAQGFTHTVNRNQNQDLYWALRGIGSGYIGIVTSYKFKLFRADNLKITFLKINYELDQTLEVLEAWQKWVQWTRKNHPKSMAIMQIKDFETIHYNVRKGIEIHTSHIQDPNMGKGERGHPAVSAEEFINMAKNIFPPNGRTVRVTTPTFMDLVIDTGYAPIQTNKSSLEIDLTALSSQVSQPRYFKVKSYFVNNWFDQSTLTKTADLIRRMPKRNILFVFNTEGGAIKNVDAGSAAYVHRNSFYSISIQYEGPPKSEEVKEGMGYVKDFMEESKIMDGGETYQNFVDEDLGDEYLKRYYAENMDKIKYTKKSWDPKNYFRNKQSIPID